jgi:hypothetical protein
MRKAGAAIATALLLITSTASIDTAASRAARNCNPMRPPVFNQDVPTAEQVLGFDLGTQKVASLGRDLRRLRVDVVAYVVP